MLRIYHSNRLDVLEEIIGYLMDQQPQADPFASEIILVESTGMAQWLQMALAEKFSIAANIEFPLPASFIWQMFRHVLAEVPQESAFTSQSMCWKLMALLPSLLDDDAFAPLRHYLRDDDDGRKMFQLCRRIAALYAQYLVYRPHWLNQWETGALVNGLDSHQCWQATLWRQLLTHTASLGQPKWHRANLYQRFIQRLQQDIPPPDLPARVFICGISSLPPVYLQALQVLGRHCDVHLMVTNPCRFYWGDIRDSAALMRLPKHQHYQQTQQPSCSVKSSASATLFSHTQGTDSGNPLLTSWGKQGRDYLWLLSELQHFAEVDAFTDIPRDSLLHHLQADLLELHNASDPPTPQDYNHSGWKRPIDSADRSLTLHLCHSPQREMEVLHDQLLTMLTNDPQLSVRDIIVMVPDIDSYSPFIQAVFAAASGDRYLPYAISDRRTRQLHPIFQAVLNLLSLPESRFTAEDVLQLLEVPALAGRFNIDETGLRYLRQWINESGIRWGISDDNVRQWQLPATGQHTWHFGLQRMLLGYAMDSRAGPWRSLLPYDESSGLIAVLVGQLADLLQQLDHWRHILAQSRPAGDWLAVYRDLLTSFFIADQQSSEVLALLEQHWQAIITPMLNAHYTDNVPLTLLRDELEQQLEQQRFSQRFLAGSINFCTLMPMRSIPFKVICLVGMNDGVYPRPHPPLGFDLMRQRPEPGDRARRDDDRYLLLEALISAQQALYISYIGRNIQDNRSCFPSVLIQELCDYIGQSHCIVGDQGLSSDDSGQRLLRHITCLHSRMPFDAANFQPASPQQSYARQWLPAASGKGQAHTPFISTPLAAMESHSTQADGNELDIDTLQRFWRHPVRSFFLSRLKVNFWQQIDDQPDNEPFTLDALQRYQLDQQLLNALIEGQDINKLYQRYRGSGQLPFAAFGDLLWQQRRDQLTDLAANVRQRRSASKTLEIDLKLDGVRLTGWLPGVQQDGLLRWQANDADGRHGLALWIEHLACCLSGKQPVSRLYGKKRYWRFMPLDSDHARAQLQMLVQGYFAGLNQPITLIPKCAGGWLDACYDQQTRQIDRQKHAAAQKKLISMWNSEHGEGRDIWYQRLWRRLEPEHHLQIISNAQRWLLPVWQHHQPEEGHQ